MFEPNKTPHFAFSEANTVLLDGKNKGVVIRLRGISESVLHQTYVIVVPSDEAKTLLRSLKANVAKLEEPL